MIGRPLQEALHDRPIGLALGQGRGIAILIHGGRHMRVSHEFLLYAHGCSGFVQPRTISVAERVKPDPAKSQLETCRNQVVGTNRIGMIRPAGHRTRKSHMESIADEMPRIAAKKGNRILIGFAAETQNLEVNALDKLKRKHLDLIVANDVTQEGAGFAVDTNIVTLYGTDGLARKSSEAHQGRGRRPDPRSHRRTARAQIQIPRAARC